MASEPDLLISGGVSKNDERRTALERFIGKNCEAGKNDPETLTVGGLTYLKRLDQTERYSFGWHSALPRFAMSRVLGK